MYVGRFAPSPSGPLHAGSLVVALASYLDAKAARGRWLLRIEDIDTPRTVAGADQIILQQLAALGMIWDGDVWYQSKRLVAYEAAFAALQTKALSYPCACTRREIADSVMALHGKFPDGERPYPGTCRQGIKPGRSPKSWRFLVSPGTISFTDRWCGPQSQDVEHQVGDFVIRRADGIWAYQLAVVVDDADQGVTDIVRGQDLLSSTARQRLLAEALDIVPPSVMHLPLVLDERGLKLSKQNGAPSINTSEPLKTLLSAWKHLELGELAVSTPEAFWQEATARWAGQFYPTRLAP
ncbi:MAG: tRNA glutamyl-Q(34) synthetase GluQRS [Burkholderiaceae bacterium]|nr:tRNA glutamyl-Q(34) synthetase GluQRS [Burkholderiaceae bacterium]MCD8518176.1 tRNA glutamyl-Q(34) synthetase GluQRS [Burkholderiaceae bacterium]MCD8536031.1 tRNA glutamyl-Q(34) synthetase GluQRS [Burkholderiaceae bacterium]MCD8564135.1 tRNA glutamyl-Q(34) synthetase GluQRS [Burkholderiaceae bacterium]